MFSHVHSFERMRSIISSDVCYFWTCFASCPTAVNMHVLSPYSLATVIVYKHVKFYQNMNPDQQTLLILEPPNLRAIRTTESFVFTVVSLSVINLYACSLSSGSYYVSNRYTCLSALIQRRHGRLTVRSGRIWKRFACVWNLRITYMSFETRSTVW